MFEKEAEEYVNEHSEYDETFDMVFVNCETKKAFKDGAEFGYNKANEWHYVKDGDLPKDDKQYLVLFYYHYKGKREEVYEVRDNLHSDFEIKRCYTEQIIAWCELPTFDKESENYTVEQNTGENQIEGGVVSISDSVVKQYRPFNNCDELVECWEKKMLVPAFMFTKDERDKLYRPSIWVKSKEYGTNLIIAFDNDNKSIGGSCVFIQDMWVDMKELFDNFTFLDGSPCGVEE